MVPIITGAPSLVGYEDDCCISYTVTIVDVRSCTRCTRVPVGQQLPHEQQGTYINKCNYYIIHSDITISSNLPIATIHHIDACVLQRSK